LMVPPCIGLILTFPPNTEANSSTILDCIVYLY
jgi:hypothetical protein